MIRFHMTIGKSTKPETWTRIAFRLPHFQPHVAEETVTLTGIYPHEEAARRAAWRWVDQSQREFLKLLLEQPQ
jgi:hypothetical protein